MNAHRFFFCKAVASVADTRWRYCVMQGRPAMMPDFQKDFEAGRALLTMNGLPVFEVSLPCPGPATKGLLPGSVGLVAQACSACKRVSRF